jgi:tetratricopeptide (TPR) repeat protein
VRLKVGVVILLFSLGATAQDRAPKPIDCDQLLSWMVAGIPSQRLWRLAHERRIAFLPAGKSAEILSKAGASPDFIKDLGTVTSSDENAHCSTQLAQAAAFVHQQNYDQAESIIHKLLTADPGNADLHLALGYLRQQQGDLDEAFDGYADAKDLNPGFPEIHNGLSNIFYRSNDAENAIAEARTALSIDPQNAEGYRYLGLGLYADEKYPAALHALQESLARDANAADTYYDIGLVQVAEKNLPAAAESYKKAIQLNPGMIEAQAGLRMVLRELEQAQAAFAQGQKSQTNSATRRY